MKIELIEQRTDHDCGIASLAMFLGRTYEEILEVYGKSVENDGMYTKEVFRVAYLLGRPLKFRKFIPGKRAFCIVPAQCSKELSHAVIYDGEQIFDPSPIRGFWHPTAVMEQAKQVFTDEPCGFRLLNDNDCLSRLEKVIIKMSYWWRKHGQPRITRSYSGWNAAAVNGNVPHGSSTEGARADQGKR